MTDEVRIPGGEFAMGSDHHYPEEAPVHRVAVDGCAIDRTLVTNEAFASFVAATGYVTVAERPLDPDAFPGAPAENLVPGSLVFTGTPGPVDLRHISQWWAWVPGACWRDPEGASSNLDGRALHPVVHVAYEDAEAYATWAGRALPSEGSFPPNGYGLADMAGNVWEWTIDWYTERHEVAGDACCVPSNPIGGREEASHDPAQPQFPIPRKVIKGGSHLCADEYCLRYRPAARRPQMIDTGTSHLGFRCVRRV